MQTAEHSPEHSRINPLCVVFSTLYTTTLWHFPTRHVHPNPQPPRGSKAQLLGDSRQEILLVLLEGRSHLLQLGADARTETCCGEGDGDGADFPKIRWIPRKT